MSAATDGSLAAAALALGDDELVLGHRDSEWAGHAPILEEDIAFANIALDEIGHASIWYRLASQWLGEDPERYPDRLIFHRPALAFRNARLVELPKGDWAFTIVRQYLFDLAEARRLAALERSRETSLARAAAKMAVEERYHLRHSAAWMVRLGRGTDESRRRMQAALDAQWPHAGQLFQQPEDGAALAEAGLFPDYEGLRHAWEAEVRVFLTEAGLAPPAEPLHPGDDRATHTEHLAGMVEDLQSVARLDLEAAW